MTDRPRESADPRYDWLYGDAPPRSSASGGHDHEPTRVLPVAGAGSSRSSAASTRPQPQADRPGGSGPGSPRDGSPGGFRPPPRPRQQRQWGRVVAIVVAVWLVYLVAVPAWAYLALRDVDAEPPGRRPADTAGTTYLLVGSDSRAGLSPEERKELSTGNTPGARTDTIMLLHAPASGRPVLVSLPRDSYVSIPGHSDNKINAAFAFGGPELLVATVEGATGLHLDGYVEIGFGGFVGLVDAVGGVEVCPKEAIRDQRAGLDIAKGCQEVDGDTALGYVRSRYEDPLGDLGRVQRQREVLAGVADKVASPWTFVNPLRYYRVNAAAAESVRVGEDTGPVDLTRFALTMRTVAGGGGTTCTVPVADPGAATPVGSAVIWDTEAAESLFAALAEDRTDDVRCSPAG